MYPIHMYRHGNMHWIIARHWIEKRETKKGNEENRLLVAYAACYMLAMFGYCVLLYTFGIIFMDIYVYLGGGICDRVLFGFTSYTSSIQAIGLATKRIYSLPCWWWLVQRAAAIYTLVLIKVCAIHVVCDPCMTIVESHFKCLFFFGKINVHFSFVLSHHWELRLNLHQTSTSVTIEQAATAVTIKTDDRTQKMKRI